MALIELNNKSGGSTGLLKLVAIDNGRVSSGASGDVLSVTAAKGQYLRLTYLITGSTAPELGITLNLSGTDVIINEYLTDYTVSSVSASGTRFGISSSFGDTNVYPAGKLFQSSELCTSFTVTKVSGTTAQLIDYVYQTLEKLT